MGPHQHLAIAIIELACREAHQGDQGAKEFLNSNSPALEHWCGVLGVSPGVVRRAAADPTWPEKVAKAKAIYLGERLPHRREGAEASRLTDGV